MKNELVSTLMIQFLNIFATSFHEQVGVQPLHMDKGAVWEENESAGDLNFFLSKLNKVASHTDTAADDSNLKNKPENRA